LLGGGVALAADFQLMIARWQAFFVEGGLPDLAPIKQDVSYQWTARR
jgi:hypothetical protein